MKFDEIIKQIAEEPYSAFFHTPPNYIKSRSYLFSSPAEIISVYNRADLEKAFELANKFAARGFIGYGLIEYEAGYLLEEKLGDLLTEKNNKLIQFLFFKSSDVKVIKSKMIDYGKFNTDEYKISDFKLNTSKQNFDKNIKRIKNYIKDGDTYQVNYTVKGKFNFEGSYSQLFKNLLFNQSAQYSAFINNGKNFIISISPELFFNRIGNKIISRPMKGTLSRSKDLMSDSVRSYELATSEKNRAENLMIVDLLRNDIGKICDYGSVKVKEFFEVEKYETLFQMVSSISGKLNKSIEFGDIVRSIFPCGSITGAPKIRTMQIIHELEKERRGIYTGSIGLIGKKSSTFNVAIRTINLDKDTGRGEMGLGSGIVWDSNTDDEYSEVILKSEFLTSPIKPFDLVETMLVENGEIFLFEKHIERLRRSAEYFLFIFNEKDTIAALRKKVSDINSRDRFKLRITLNKWGSSTIEFFELGSAVEEINVIVSEQSISTSNVMQYFKTTNRQLYNDEFKKYSEQDYSEVLFLNEKKELAEGSFTNIIIKKDDQWLTPAILCGVLPGVYRNYLLQNNKLKEAILKVEDLLYADEVKLINSVRKELSVKRLYYNNEFVEYEPNKN